MLVHGTKQFASNVKTPLNVDRVVTALERPPFSSLVSEKHQTKKLQYL